MIGKTADKQTDTILSLYVEVILTTQHQEVLLSKMSLILNDVCNYMVQKRLQTNMCIYKQ